jgi:hypothetical protein
MSELSIDFNRFYEELKNQGEKLCGLFKLQYPLYCIHAEIIHTAPDPMEQLDDAIISFFRMNQRFTTRQIACIIGTSGAVITQRVEVLVRDKLLSYKDGVYTLTSLGELSFKHKSQVRQHFQSYDFYIDGLTLQPLSRVFYTNYHSDLINEHDVIIRTVAEGETKVIKPFGPDLVHTPPDNDLIIRNIMAMPDTDRDTFCIPQGLQSINQLEFTKMSFYILVAVSTRGDIVKKQLINGYAYYSVLDNLSYYETLRKDVAIFEREIKSKIDRLEFKINIPDLSSGKERSKAFAGRPMLVSNWQEIDNYPNSRGTCYRFSLEDLCKLIAQSYRVGNVPQENVINNDTTIAVRINRQMLMSSPDRYKLISSLIRERDFVYGEGDTAVLILYLHYAIEDVFVDNVVKLKKLVDKTDSKDINMSWIDNLDTELKQDFRMLLLAASELDILEKLDIEQHMLAI